jgi:hypothetical protein
MYRRSDGAESLIIVLNISEEAASLEIELTESTLAFATSPECKVHDEGRRKRIVLPPFGGVVLQ